MLVGRSGGRTKPSVNSEEPLISKARSNPLTPRAWNIAVYAVTTITIHTTGRSSSPTGPYSAITESRPS